MEFLNDPRVWQGFILGFLVLSALMLCTYIAARIGAHDGAKEALEESEEKR